MESICCVEKTSADENQSRFHDMDMSHVTGQKILKITASHWVFADYGLVEFKSLYVRKN